jgi:hypothetical protein
LLNNLPKLRGFNVPDGYEVKENPYTFFQAFLIMDTKPTLDIVTITCDTHTHTHTHTHTFIEQGK